MASYKNGMGEYFVEKEGPLLGVGLKRRARGRRLKNQETLQRGIQTRRCVGAGATPLGCTDELVGMRCPRG